MNFKEFDYFEVNDYFFQEIKEKIMERLKSEIKNDIELLKQKNKKLAEDIDILKIKNQELLVKANKTKNEVEDEIFNLTIRDVLIKAFSLKEIFFAKVVRTPKQKCSFCDEYRNVEVFLPSGGNLKAQCDCYGFEDFYKKDKAILNKVICGGEFDGYKSFKFETIYSSEDNGSRFPKKIFDKFDEKEILKEMNSLSTDRHPSISKYDIYFAFTTEIECEKYIAWLNSNLQKNREGSLSK